MWYHRLENILCFIRPPIRCALNDLTATPPRIALKGYAKVLFPVRLFFLRTFPKLKKSDMLEEATSSR